MGNNLSKQQYEQEYPQLARERFQHIQDKRILIYGTGVIAKRLMKALYDYRIIGAVDGLYLGGEVEKLPILLWDEIEQGDVDVVIIAALEKNYRNIYQRILDKCVVYGISIYGENGHNLREEYGWNPFRVEDARYYRKNEAELKRLIAGHDAISFDLFDTLIMRKTLVPTDVFDIVEDRLKKEQIPIENFRVLRKEAEIQGWGNIYQIYENLREMAGWNAEQTKQALEIELACEKSVLVPRIKMVEILNYAKKLGKKINIISDMYLPADILDSLLKDMNITGYEKIYVSCDYGVGKGNGLYERYLQDISDMKCLHIGDNKFADEQVALKCGINVYGIKNAYDMMKISNFRYILPCANNCNEKSLLGLILADVFNDPFVLYGTSGIVHLHKVQSAGNLLVAPMAVLYILELFAHLQKHRDYNKVIFGARDGYIFQKLYDGIRERLKEEVELPESVYLLTSRKICLRATTDLKDNISYLDLFRGGRSPEAVLTDTLGLKKEKVAVYEEERYGNVEEYYFAHIDAIKEKSQAVRLHYLRYLRKSGLDLSQKHLLCDLVSHGNVQYRLAQLLEGQLDGFYMCKNLMKEHYDIEMYPIYQSDYGVRNIFADTISFMEPMFSSPEPSIEDIGENSVPVYAKEVRTKKQINIMLEEQKGIEDFFFDYFDNLWIEGKKIKKELTKALLDMCDNVEYKGKCKNIREKTFFDDCIHVYYEA